MMVGVQEPFSIPSPDYLMISISSTIRVGMYIVIKKHNIIKHICFVFTRIFYIYK